MVRVEEYSLSPPRSSSRTSIKRKRTNGKQDEDSEKLLEGLRRKAEKYEKLGMYNTAVFLSDKALTISGATRDVLLLARYG